MKKISSCLKRLCAILLAVTMVAGLAPAAGVSFRQLIAHAEEDLGGAYELNNGYIKVTVSPNNGGFGIRTVEGDKINKSDNDRYLVYEYDEDNTSFTSFRVTRGGETKEYIFGGEYAGSSEVTVSKEDGELIAVWSVDDLTFTQTISLVATGSTEHGSALISYSVENTGEPAEIKCRILMDTALGYQDFAYYNIGNKFEDFEVALTEDGYNKSFYAANNPSDPTIMAYTINASIDNEECKPYQTIFAHWNNLASTVFDYTPDTEMNFTNPYNIQYLTSDSAYALYFDLGQVAEGGTAMAATNYGVYSNESVSAEATVSVNVNAPDVMEFAVGADGKEDQTAYENGGRFDVKTYIENFGTQDYEKIRIMVYAAGGIDPLDQDGNPTNSTYENPYSMDIADVTAGEQIEIDWGFIAEPQETGQYAKVHYKIYNVGDAATLGTGVIMTENLLGEGHSYILCPGSVEKIPAIKFTGSSPDTIYTSGLRNLFVTGENFSMLLDTAAYRVMLSRVDGNRINGETSVEIPADQVKIDDATNVMTVIFSEDTPGTLAEGMYQLTIDYTDTSKEDISGQALRFHVSSDVKYKNDSYGFLAVIKDKDNLTYSIERFTDADEYWMEVENKRILRENVLLELKGSFIKEKTDDESVTKYTGTSLSDTDNVMTLNDCLDIRDGVMTVTEKDGSVTVDFDAEIYTTGSGTHVWSGMAALTELEAGTEYTLIPYGENGERVPDEEEYPSVVNYSGEPITLLWPSVGQGFQSLMGLLFELKYGELGVILHEEATTEKGSETRVVGFGAAMDLSFLIPGSVDKQVILDSGGKTKDILGSSWDAAEHNSISFSPAEIRALNKQANCRANTAKTDATPEDVEKGNFTDMTVDETPGYNAATIVIDDVLFGGEYLGVNMEVCLGVPPFIMGMPAIEAVLSVHTVGDWSFSVDGQCHFMNFKLEAGIAFKSKDDTPIPDRLSFFLGGIEPGFNVDGVGVLWLQGAGGGVENLYDTFFMTDSIPPIKLIIEAQFSIMQLFNARARLGLSLRGIDVSLTNGQFTEHTNEETGVVTRPQPITMDASMVIDWYPEFYFEGVVNLMLAMCINGGGYVVADADGFYEFFIRAGVQIPSDTPLIGGISLTDVNMGVNDEKVWGQAEWLDQVIGITYYWGGDIDWNSGSKVYPTYPELVGMEPEGVAVMAALDYDEETGETLVMAIGTNMVLSASTMGLSLTKYSDDPDVLETDAVTGALHTMKVNNNGNGKMLMIQWTADTLEKAQADAAGIKIADKDNSANQYPIVVLDNAFASNAPENAGANANLAYDEASKTAYFTVSLSDTKVFDHTWTVYTPESSQLVIYDVEPLPQIKVESAAVENDKVTVQLSGNKLDEFSKLTFFAEGKNSGESYLLGGATDPFAEGKRSAVLTLPVHMVSDTYTLRIVGTDSASRYYAEADAEITYTNPNQPSAPTGVSAENAGDYTVAVKVGESGEEIDGYRFTAYDKDGNPVSGVTDVLLYADGSAVSYNDDGTIKDAPETAATDTFIIGGHYEYTAGNEDTGEEETMVTGLSAGEYTIKVSSWKKADNGAVLASAPVSVTITVKEPVKTEITVNATAVTRSASGQSTMTRGDGSSYELDSFGSSAVQITLSSDAESFTGKWRLDGGFREGTNGEITAATKSASLNFSGLEDGVHLLYFVGENEYGDAVSKTYQFVVDTLAPRLMLAEPVNGGLFDYWTGALTVSGITDKDAQLTIVDNTTGEALYASGGNVALSVDEGGNFAVNVTLDRTILEHELIITVTDAMGNAAEKVITVMSNGLGSIDELLLYAGDSDVTNTKLAAGGNYTLKLMAKLERPENADATSEDLYVQINKAGMIDWVQTVVEGESELIDDTSGAVLKSSQDAEGMVTARFLINDAGAYTVSASFGYTGTQLIDLNSVYTLVKTTDQLYTGSAVTTDVTVWYRGEKLTEGTDYVLGSYFDNVNVSTGSTEKPRVEIIGINGYTGTVIESFEISYLPTDESYYVISGVAGDNGYYTSDVNVLAAAGYEIIAEPTDTEEAEISLSDDKSHTVEFMIRRISDGAVTDTITEQIKIDKTAPTGTVVLDEKSWDKFLKAITFGLYKVKNYTATVTAADSFSGVSKIEYVISENAYESVTDLAAAGLIWAEYSDSAKPTLKDNTDQIIYVKLTDMAGNESCLSSDGIHADTKAPVLSGMAINEDATRTDSSLTFTFISDEAGTYYYAVLKADQPAPDAAALKAQNVADAKMGSGNITAQTSGQPITLAVNGLEENTLYVAYVVVEDTVVMLSDGSAAPNTSAVAASAPVSTASNSLTGEEVTVKVEDVLYTGSEVFPAVEVYYDGTKLTENRDYQVTYHNNIEVSAGRTEKPYVEIIGLGDFAGTVTEEFEISYLAMEEPYYTISGVEGDNGYYISDVNIIAAEGYEILTDLIDGVTENMLNITEERDNTAEIWIRRVSDGAITDKITLVIKIDKTAPTGTITLDAKGWDKFLENITFGIYKVNNYAASVSGADSCSGVGKIEYVISETAYESVNALAAAGLTWAEYSDSAKPTIKENTDQIIYVKITDMAGNESYISSEGIYADTTAPTISDVSIRVDTSLTENSLEFVFTSSEAGTYYYAVVKADQAVPSAGMLKAQQIKGAVMGTGSITSEMCGEPITIAVSGLEADTEYVVYVAAEDVLISLGDGAVASNVSEVIGSEPVSTEAILYIITEGDGDTWTKGSGKDQIFVADGPYDKFVGLMIDGELVDAENYTAESGSTIVTVKESWLETLPEQSYMIAVLYTDGTAYGTFTIAAAPEEPVVPETPAGPVAPEPEVPEGTDTGDHSDLALWFALMGVSAVGMIAVVILVRKRKSKTE